MILFNMEWGKRLGASKLLLSDFGERFQTLVTWHLNWCVSVLCILIGEAILNSRYYTEIAEHFSTVYNRGKVHNSSHLLKNEDYNLEQHVLECTAILHTNFQVFMLWVQPVHMRLGVYHSEEYALFGKSNAGSTVRMCTNTVWLMGSSVNSIQSQST